MLLEAQAGSVMGFTVSLSSGPRRRPALPEPLAAAARTRGRAWQEMFSVSAVKATTDCQFPRSMPIAMARCATRGGRAARSEPGTELAAQLPPSDVVYKNYPQLTTFSSDESY